MDKQEALAVLQEISDLCKKGWIITCISLDCPSSQISQNSTNGYQIKMKCKLDKYSKNCLKPIMQQHNLDLQEENGYVTLFSK
jgi:hypothetical protein